VPGGIEESEGLSSVGRECAGARETVRTFEQVGQTVGWGVS
jgi:hypothetical protein